MKPFALTEHVIVSLAHAGWHYKYYKYYVLMHILHMYVLGNVLYTMLLLKTKLYCSPIILLSNQIRWQLS